MFSAPTPTMVVSSKTTARVFDVCCEHEREGGDGSVPSRKKQRRDRAVEESRHIDAFGPGSCMAPVRTKKETQVHGQVAQTVVAAPSVHSHASFNTGLLVDELGGNMPDATGDVVGFSKVLGGREPAAILDDALSFLHPGPSSVPSSPHLSCFRGAAHSSSLSIEWEELPHVEEHGVWYLDTRPQLALPCPVFCRPAPENGVLRRLFGQKARDASMLLHCHETLDDSDGAETTCGSVDARCIEGGRRPRMASGSLAALRDGARAARNEFDEVATSMSSGDVRLGYVSREKTTERLHAVFTENGLQRLAVGDAVQSYGCGDPWKSLDSGVDLDSAAWCTMDLETLCEEIFPSAFEVDAFAYWFEIY